MKLLPMLNSTVTFLPQALNILSCDKFGIMVLLSTVYVQGTTQSRQPTFVSQPLVVILKCNK